MQQLEKKEKKIGKKSNLLISFLAFCLALIKIRLFYLLFSKRLQNIVIADWPILNALLNTAAGAHWVSFHHGGGVGIGYSLHAGMVVVADGTDDAEDRLARVLTTDCGMGVVRHADAGYEIAIETADAQGIDWRF